MREKRRASGFISFRAINKRGIDRFEPLFANIIIISFHKYTSIRWILFFWRRTFEKSENFRAFNEIENRVESDPGESVSLKTMLQPIFDREIEARFCLNSGAKGGGIAPGWWMEKFHRRNGRHWKKTFPGLWSGKGLNDSVTEWNHWK